MICSQLKACLEVVSFYAVTNRMSAEEFSSFSRPDNTVAQILMAHFWTLGLVVQQYTMGHSTAFIARKNVQMHWVEKVALALPGEQREHLDLPLRIVLGLRSRTSPARGEN